MAKKSLNEGIVINFIAKFLAAREEVRREIIRKAFGDDAELKRISNDVTELQDRLESHIKRLQSIKDKMDH